MSDQMKSILVARDIPLGATVTKRTGTKEYKLLDRIRIFPINRTGSLAERNAPEVENPPGEVLAPKDTLFLVCDGNANTIPADLELVWVCSHEGLRHFLDDGRRNWEEPWWMVENPVGEDGDLE